MRPFLFVSALALSVTLSAAAHAQATPQRFAFVNTQLILQSAPGATEAQALFQKDVETMRLKVKALSDSLAALEAAYNKEAAGLTDLARGEKLKVLTDKKNGFEDRAQELNDQAEQRQFDLMQPIMDKVRKALDDLRLEDGYTFIFDVANSSFIVAADKNMDVTERVIARLRTMSKAVAAPATTGPTAKPVGVQAKPPMKSPTR